MKDIVIVGGGVAGLCAANRLVNAGASVTLIEARSYPSHKICGEFFSPECLPLLEEWGVLPETQIDEVSVIVGKKRQTFQLPLPARSGSRYDFDARLLERAKAKGARILTETAVTRVEPGVLTLQNDARLPYGQLIMGAGRLFGAARPRYIGFKGHFEGVPMGKTLEMYALKGAYIGLSPLAQGQTNAACLVRLNEQNRNLTPEELLASFYQEVPYLKEKLQGGCLLFKEWLHCLAPAFGMKKPPAWAHTYFIGDAAATIPPACGSGLSMAITSGCRAADYALQDDAVGFQKEWEQLYRAPLRYGQVWHSLLLRPRLTRFLQRGSQMLPGLPKTLFALTRP